MLAPALSGVSARIKLPSGQIAAANDSLRGGGRVRFQHALRWQSGMSIAATECRLRDLSECCRLCRFLPRRPTAQTRVRS